MNFFNEGDWFHSFSSHTCNTWKHLFSADWNEGPVSVPIICRFYKTASNEILFEWDNKHYHSKVLISSFQMNGYANFHFISGGEVFAWSPSWILFKLWWFFLCRVLRRVVRLLSHCSVLEASNEASLRQAQSASDQCKRLMDENEELKKVICKLKSQGKKWLCKDSTSIGDPAVFTLDCKTVHIFAYSSTREQSNKRSGTRLKTES